MTAQKLSGRLKMEVGSLEVNGIDGPFEITTRQKDINVNEFKHSLHITDSDGQITPANLHAAHPRYPGGIEKRRRGTDPPRRARIFKSKPTRVTAKWSATFPDRV